MYVPIGQSIDKHSDISKFNKFTNGSIVMMIKIEINIEYKV